MNPVPSEQGRLFAAVKRVNRRIRERRALAEAVGRFGESAQAVQARILGVTREHLNRVLNGHRQSRRLRAGYNRLVKGEEATHVA